MGTEELTKSKKWALQVTQVVFHSVVLWSVVLLIQYSALLFGAR